jgi:hypothetical protein
MPRKCLQHGKTCFPGENSARKALRALDIDRMLAVGTGHKVPVRAYRDPRCGWWHLTSQPG